MSEIIEGARPLNPLNLPGGLDHITSGGPGRQIENVLIRPSNHVVVDETFTNHLIYTDDFSNAIWVKDAGVTITSSSVETPDVNKTATKVTCSSNPKNIRQTITGSFALGDILWFTVFIQGTDVQTARITIENLANSQSEFEDIELVDGLWSFAEVSITLTASATNQIRVTIRSDVTGDIYIFAPQVIADTDRFSQYIPSTGTKGTLDTYISVPRFTMYEDTDSPAATLCYEDDIRPDDAAIAMEAI
jgi:hypothetical protein